MLRAAACILLLGIALAGRGQAPSAEAIAERYRDLVQRISVERLQGHYSTIAGFGSRIAGSPGEAAALHYAEREFRRLGLRNVRRETFDVTVPDPEAKGVLLSPQGRRVTIYPLWPNLVRTSTCQIEGPLVYGGQGTLEELSGKPIMGSIVLLEFGSMSNWRQAAKLGARAIVFIGSDIPRVEAEQKFSAVPLDIPRFYLPLKDAAEPLAAAFEGRKWRLSCLQRWVKLESANVMADLPGSDSSAARERVLLFGYADSMSVVPALSPGAEAAGSLAALLELAENYAANRPRRPIRFVASGAHFLALQGAREYVARRLREERDDSQLATVTLDLNSGSRALGLFGRGWFYEYRDESQDRMRNFARHLRRHADRLAPVLGALSPRLVLTDAVNHSDNRTWKNNIPARFGFDCEPFVQARLNAYTFATIETARERVDTPNDTLEHVNLANVVEQLKSAFVMTHHLLNDTSDRRAVGDHTVPLDVVRPRPMSLVGGFATIEGQVAIYDPQKGFVPNVKVPNALVILENPLKSLMGVRGTMIVSADEQARYRLIGAAPVSSYWFRNARDIQIAAFRIDEETGRITHAPTYGAMGGNEYDTIFELRSSYKSTPIVVFPCVSIDFYELVDPQDLRTFMGGMVLDAQTDAPPTNFGFFVPLTYQRSSAEVEDTAAIFLSAGQRFKLLLGSGLGEIRLILVNGTRDYPSGHGYLAPGDASIEQVARDDAIQFGRFLFPSLQSSRDILFINDERLRKFAEHRIISEGIDSLQRRAHSELQGAEEALAAQNWPEVDRRARAAWGYALRAHPIIQKTANDVVNGVLFYLFLLIPFSAFLERLIWGHRALTKQLGFAMGIFVVAFVIIRSIHPAFEIVSNPSMIFVAFVMGTLSLIVIAFITGKFESALKAVKQSESGVHEVDIRRVSVAMAAFNLGVSNMRRRKARTMLTTLTLVVMTFIVLSFTSIVPEVRLNEQASDTKARYSGVLIRNPGLEPMENSTYVQLANEFRDKARVVRRAWYYGADIGEHGVLALRNADRISEARALIGMEPEESQVLRLQEALAPGGRWFAPGDRRVMILPQPLADALNVSHSDVGKATVTFAGQQYLVIGILDAGILRQVVDLDADQVLPADFNLSNRLQQETSSTTEAFRTFIRLDPAQVFFVPLETSLNLGADIRSVAASFEQPAQTRAALDALMPRLRLNLYASVPGPDGGVEVRQFSVLQAQRGSGMGLILVQMAIASIFILNTMIASVFERRREISIFSAVGLAPNHIAMLFFAESLVYGVLGAVFGYIAAQTVAKIVVVTDSFPGLYLNFSSTSAVMAAGLVMGVVLLSTIYPARVAARIAAPARNEDEMGEEPEGDEWTIQLPFSVSAAEAGPLLQFLSEWYAAYEEYTIGDFVTSGTEVAHRSDRHVVRTRAWLAPYDLGVAQDMELEASPTAAEGIYRLDLRLKRISGEHANWITVNRRFLASLRKQFLTWRTLDADQRLKYEERATLATVGAATRS